MAKIYPFQALRYTAQAGPLASLVTQPYDKISPAMQARYLSLSPYNLVRLILGERKPDDNEAANVYTRAAAYLNDWIACGVLARDAAPAIFPYFQDFTVPDTGERLTRKGFIALGAVEDYSAGVVHRHEQTLAGPKKDRLELLRHTHAHFGQIFMLYPDRAGEIDALLEEAAQVAPLAEVTDEYGVGHRMWRIAAAARIQELMADKKLLIADETVTHLGQTRTWSEFLAAITLAMQGQDKTRGAGLRLLTESVVSPTLAQQLKEPLKKLPEAKWHIYEPVHRDTAWHGAQMAFGEAVNPIYDFRKADVVLSLDADFPRCGPGNLAMRPTSWIAAACGRPSATPRRQR